MDLFALAKHLNGTVHPESAKNIAILNAQVLEKATTTDISYITKPCLLKASTVFCGWGHFVAKPR